MAASAMLIAASLSSAMGCDDNVNHASVVPAKFKLIVDGVPTYCDTTLNPGWDCALKVIVNNPTPSRLKHALNGQDWVNVEFIRAAHDPSRYLVRASGFDQGLTNPLPYSWTQLEAGIMLYDHSIKILE